MASTTITNLETQPQWKKDEYDLVSRAMHRQVLPMRARRLKAIVGGLFLAAASAFGFDHSHANFAVVLSQHVTNGLVNYRALKEKPGELQAYLAQMDAVAEAEFKAWSREDQLAFLINLYNASVLKLIIQHYPVKSIKNIGGWLGRVWDVDVVPLFGKVTGLGYLEHELIRKYNEPRIHFALVCGARGCPELRTEPYTATNLNAQLADQGRRFLRDRSKNHVNARTQTIYLSPIFKWFADDFKAHSGTVFKFVQSYRPELQPGPWKIRYTDYDWSLNDSAPRR